MTKSAKTPSTALDAASEMGDLRHLLSALEDAFPWVVGDGIPDETYFALKAFCRKRIDAIRAGLHEMPHPEEVPPANA